MQIKPTDVDSLMTRFDSCCDGLLHSIGFTLIPEPDSAVVVVESHDSESPSGWSRLTFSMAQVEKARVEVGTTILQILSGGIQLIWEKDLVYLVLDAYPDDGPGLPDLARNHAYISGKQCSLAIKFIELPFPPR